MPVRFELTGIDYKEPWGDEGPGKATVRFKVKSAYGEILLEVPIERAFNLNEAAELARKEVLQFAYDLVKEASDPLPFARA